MLRGQGACLHCMAQAAAHPAMRMRKSGHEKDPLPVRHEGTMGSCLPRHCPGLPQRLRPRRRDRGKRPFAVSTSYWSLGTCDRWGYQLCPRGHLERSSRVQDRAVPRMAERGLTFKAPVFVRARCGVAPKSSVNRARAPIGNYRGVFVAEDSCASPMIVVQCHRVPCEHRHGSFETGVVLTTLGRAPVSCFF
jgi:hypothetical protein